MARKDVYSNFEELKRERKLGIDYAIRTMVRPLSPVAIVAPHGGRIEYGTSDIARELAGSQHNFYAFEGIQPSGNRELHITSANFDEPTCLEMLSRCSSVIAIHGFQDPKPRVMLGGLDADLIDRITRALLNVEIQAELGGKFEGRHFNNVCNRGLLRKGVQIELSLPFRRGESKQAFVTALGNVLQSISEK